MRKRYIIAASVTAAAIITVVILASYTMEVRTEIAIAAPLETVWSILTDFKMYVLDSLLTYGM